MSEINNNKEIEKKEILYNYWDKLPLVINIDTPSEEVLSHDVRNLILYFIRKGKEDKLKDGSIRVRHSFSARELLDMSNIKLDEKMKLQSMYFHLQKLQEYGIIDIITTIHEGRHNIAYFGRTARGFVFENKKDKTKYDEYFMEGGRYAHALNSKIPGEEFKKFLKEFKEINQEIDIKIIQWLQDKANIINENNIDVATMFSFLRRINYHNQKMTSLMKEVAKLIEFDL